MFDIILVGCFNKGVDTVVDIFLYRIVYGTFTTRTSCSVIIDTESASTVYEIYIIAHLVKVDIILCSLAKSCLNTTNFGNLTTNMEVDKS